MRLALAFCLLLLHPGCAEKDRPLTFWVGGAPQEVDFWEELVARFEARSGIRVEVVRQPAATEQRKQGLVIALAAGQPDPDIFLMDIIWIPHFVGSGWLEPLDAHFGPDTLNPDLFFPSVVDAVDRHGDRHYALPAFLDVGVLYYRKDLLHRHGFAEPGTWEDLVDQARRIQAAERPRNPGFSGFVWQGAQYEGLVCTFLEFLATHGGGILTNGRVALERPENARALQFMQDLIGRYGISPPNTYTEMREENVRRAFQRGDALFERNWLYAWSLHQGGDSNVRGRVGLTALPSVPGARTATTLGGWHLGISKSADAKDRAWRLAAYLLSKETQIQLLKTLGWYSCRRDVYVDPEVRRTVANAGRLEEIVAHAVSRPQIPYYDPVSRILQRHVNDALSGRRGAVEALSAMQEEIERVEAYYGRP